MEVCRMKITAIKAQIKNPERVSIFVDNTYSFSLTLDQLLQEKLKKGDELEERTIKQLIKVSDDGKLKQRALEWLLTRPHSTREFRDYLYRKQADKELIEQWTEEFTLKRYLDDKSFAKWFAENRRRKNKSDRAITAELYSKGISAVTIKDVVIELNEDLSYQGESEKEALIKLVNKLSSRPRYSDRNKLTQHLISKGFSYQLVKEVLESRS